MWIESCRYGLVVASAIFLWHTASFGSTVLTKGEHDAKRVDQFSPVLKYYSRDDETTDCSVSIYCEQNLPRGIWLGPALFQLKDITLMSSSDHWSFAGCKPIAYLYYYRVDPAVEGDEEFHYIPVTEIVCACKNITYQENDGDPIVIPKGITATTYGICVAASKQSTRSKGKCDCHLPTVVLPVISPHSANRLVLDISNVDDLKVTLDGSPNSEQWTTHSLPLETDEPPAATETRPLFKPPRVNVMKISKIKPSGTTGKYVVCGPRSKNTAVTAIGIPIVVVILVILGLCAVGCYFYFGRSVTLQDSTVLE